MRTSRLLATLNLVAGVQPATREPEMERSFNPGTLTVLESPGPRAPHKVVFEDDGATGYFYALDVSRTDDSQIVDALRIYDVKASESAKPPCSVCCGPSTAGKSRCSLMVAPRRCSISIGSEAMRDRLPPCQRSHHGPALITRGPTAR